MRSFFMTLVCCLAAGRLPAADNALPIRMDLPPLPPAQECRFADGEMRIDGQADEPSWTKAPVIDAFSQ